jgi:phosphate transport system substrate-binding protein
MSQHLESCHAGVMRILRIAFTACCTIGATAAAQDLKIGGAGPLIGTMEMLADTYNKAHPGSRVEVVPRKNNKAISMGTKKGIENGINGTYEGVPFIGFSSEHLNDAQRKAGGQELELARVALVFVVSAKNAPVDNITTQQVIDIYSLKMREWRPGLPVRLVRRPLKESDNEILMTNIPQLRPLIVDLLDPNRESERGLMPPLNDAQDSADYIEERLAPHPGAFGTSSMNQIITENRALKPLKLDGIEPSTVNVVNGSYRLYKPVLLITGRNVTPEMRDFIAFVQTKAGRDIFVKTGHAIMGDAGKR